MIAPKDVRPLLSAMSAESIISIQEVPKSADRNPTRMFYLWSAYLSIRLVEPYDQFVRYSPGMSIYPKLVPYSWETYTRPCIISM